MSSAPWSVLAIVGFVTSFVVGVVGVVLSILGLRETVRTGKRGRGLAIAGIVVGGAFTLFAVILVLFIVLVVLPVALRESGGNAAGVSQSPAVFGQSDAAPASGAYDVVRSAFTHQDSGDRGEAWARVFDDGGNRIGVVTAW